MSKGSVTFIKGNAMHTRNVGLVDKDIWILPDNIDIDDNKLYIIDYKTTYPGDPSDMGSHTVVYHIEEVPENILYGISEVHKFESIINEYKKSFALYDNR